MKLIALAGWALAVGWALLWSLELRRNMDREEVLFEQIALLEGRRGVRRPNG